jgi:hypothetical protein
LVAAAVFALTLWPGSPADAQSSTADGLSERVSRLYRAGGLAEGIPSAEQTLEIRENALGPIIPMSRWR